MMELPAAMAHLEIYDTVERLLADAPRGRLLDVPAGRGALARRLLKAGFDVECCDLYPDIFDLPGVMIHSGDLDRALPFEDATFDHVVCVEGLEHIENPANAIREFNRILKPSGTLVVSVPNIMNIEERLKWLISGYTSHFKPLSQPALEAVRTQFAGMEEIALHISPIGYSELRFLLERAGFRVDAVVPDKPKRNTWAFFPLTSAIRLIGRLQSGERRRERWSDELNSDAVLLGGNTLIFKAVKT